MAERNFRGKSFYGNFATCKKKNFKIFFLKKLKEEQKKNQACSRAIIIISPLVAKKPHGGNKNFGGPKCEKWREKKIAHFFYDVERERGVCLAARRK